ncbi:hypothetical protein J5N97_014096 [Dioscorea zingiberensis]|uniref:Uncharacterized protein n=1 Tax=Dioscorea zingiberensis TaxID=325984 RepID=A0A9D5CTC1_9LILI|nr:hypothetical protein J5N97_014096 [Dioscorea zingiberensis]
MTLVEEEVTEGSTTHAGGTSTTTATHKTHPMACLSLKASPKTGTGKQAHPYPGAALKKNNPVRERVSFAETVARELKKTFVVEALTTPGVHQSKSSDEDEGWQDVHFKR